MSNKLVLYGASNPSTLKILRALNREALHWELVGFIDDTPGRTGEDYFGFPILGPKEHIRELDLGSILFFNNVFGSMAGRRQVARALEEAGCTLTSLLSPDVDVSCARIGTDVAIEENVSLDLAVEVGDHGCVKRNASVGHESLLEEFVFIGPGVTVCGRVTIRAGAFIGAGSVIRDGVEIGGDTVVGAGAVVVGDLPPGVTAVGNPARPMKE